MANIHGELLVRNLRRVSWLAGASLLALGAAPAFGQATPGSPQCPVVANIVTCAGSLPDGISIPSGPYLGLTVENVTGDMAATNRPVIRYIAGQPDTAIRINDTDSTLRLTTVEAAGADQLLGAIDVIATNAGTFTLDSNVDIVGVEQDGAQNNTFYLPVGILVRGSGGSFAIANSGDISLSGIDGPAESAGILVDTFGASLVTVRNSGVMNLADGGRGIAVAADNQRVEITNEANITVGGSAGFGIELRYQIARFTASPGFTRPGTPTVPLESYRIVNSALIDVRGTSSWGINVTNSAAGAPASGLGAPSGEIVNSGTIRSGLFGIVASHAGNRNILNSGRIELATNIGTIRGIIVGTTTDTVRNDIVVVENSATGVIIGTGAAGIGYDVRNTPGTLRNAGQISMTGVSSRGMFISGNAAGLGLTRIENSGTIHIDGDNSFGIDAGFGADAAGPVSDTRLTSSGLIEALGANSTGLSFVHADTRGIVAIDLAATSIVRGGTGTGAGIVLAGGAQHSILNAGLITAGSGRAIVGGTAAEAVDNSGRIEGSVALAAGADSVINRAGGTIIGAIDLGAAADLLDNSGQITGNVSLGAGDDVLIVRAGGRLDGNLNLGDGNDRVTLAANSFTGNLIMGVTGAQIVTIEGPQVFNQLIGSNDDDMLILTGTANYAFNVDQPRITGIGTIVKDGNATITLNHPVTENFSFSNLEVRAGTLLVTGQLALQDGLVTGGTLTGATSFNNLTATGGTIAPGNGGPGQLTVLGNLSLGANSRLLFDLGAPGQVGGGDNDLIAVTRNLVLDGTLDISARPNFGDGVYRLINYGGTLTNNGLVMGNAPAATYQIQTSTAGQINLVVAGISDLSIQFWDGGDTAPDGTIDGGAGTWGAATTNWTNAAGTVNHAWAGNFAVFQGAGGAVSVVGQQSVGGLQFTNNGYVLSAGAGGGLTLGTAETAIRVDPGVTAELALPVGGAGALVKRDTGTLILSGTNGYSGGTIVREGVLQISSDASLGAAAGGVTLDGGTLRFGGALSSARAFTIGASGGTLDPGANAITLSSAIGGTGALTKTGTGTLTYTGNSSAFGGTFNVNAGTLRLDGTLGGTLLVGTSGRLMGGGTMRNLDLAGTLAPGASAGTLSASGNVIFRAGSTFEVEIAAAGGRDLLAVTGTATIEGGTVRILTLDPETQYTDGSRYTFLTAAGGRTGQFATLAENSAFLDFTLGYDATSAFVTVSVIRTFPDVALTFNQRQSSTALAVFGRTAGSDSLAVYNAILMLDDAPARAAFDAASGEIYPVMLAAAGRRAAARADDLIARAQAPEREGWGAWLLGGGASRRTDSDGNGAQHSSDGLGAAFGIDYRGPGNGWAVGLAGGYDWLDITLRDRASSGDSDGWHIGGYARYGNGGAGFTLAASASYASLDADIARSIAFGSLSRLATANVEADAFGAAAELRYGFAVGGGWSLGPVARIGHESADLGGFAETGAGSLDVTGATGNDDSRTRYGGGAFARWEGVRGSLDAALAYQARAGAPAEVGLVMAGAPGQSYRVRAAEDDAAAAILTVAGRLELGAGWSLDARFAGALGRDERSAEGSATLGWRF